VALSPREQDEIKTQSLFQRALYRLRRDRLTMLALGVLVVMTALSLLSPIINSQILGVDPARPDPRNNYALPMTEIPNEDGTVTLHILGTDELGRDHLGRLLWGGQVSLRIAFFAAVLALTIGMTLGVITGYFGGVFDDFMIWFITTLNSVPQLFLLLLLNAVLSPGTWTLTLVLAFLGWTGAMRLVRGETLSLREREFVLSAQAVGASSWRVMFVHILPNVISIMIIALAISIGQLILTEAALSFLGFGVKSPTPSWGNMLSAGLDLLRRAPHLVIAPGLLISITVLCLYVIGDGIRDAFDPKMND
jgi:peptide/nickel transport system permease protein